MVSTTIDSASNTNHSQSEEDSSSQGPRLFTRFMKEQCWRKHAIVPGRDPERWRYDKAGNPVCRQMTGCDGLVCHEYDHIVPFAKGGSTSVENCQILQTRGTPLTVNYQNENSFYWKVNRLKKDAEGVSVEQLRQMSAPYPFTMEELDLVEMSVYGDLRRGTDPQITAPLPTLGGSVPFCRCKSLSEFHTASKHGSMSKRQEDKKMVPTCATPRYERQTPVPPAPQLKLPEQSLLFPNPQK